MHHADIQAALKKLGVTQTAIASSVIGRSGGPVTVGAVYLVIRGLAKSKAIASHISQVLGRPVSDLWPGKYPDIEAAEQVARHNPHVFAQAQRLARTPLPQRHTPPSKAPPRTKPTKPARTTRKAA